MKAIKKVFMRSFLIQAVWNYESMQSIGFLYSLLPLLKEMGLEKKQLIEICKRHTGYFNTHPYMAGIILGYVARQEAKLKESGGDVGQKLMRFKLQMGGPLAALGDKMFWSTLRPLVGIIAVFLVLIDVTPYYLIPVIFILLYNIPTIAHRYFTLLKVYSGKYEVAGCVEKATGNKLLRSLPVIGLVFVCLCIASAMFRWGLSRGILLIIFTAVVVLLREVLKMSSTRILYTISFVVVAGYLLVKLL